VEGGVLAIFDKFSQDEESLLSAVRDFSHELLKRRDYDALELILSFVFEAVLKECENFLVFLRVLLAERSN